MKEDEIASLKAQLVDLQSRLDAVEGCRPVVKPAPRPDEPAVRIEQIFEERRGDAPSAAELQKLLATVGRAFPDLAKALNAESDGFELFSNAFRWAQNIKRAAEPNEHFYPSTWRDDAQAWCEARGIWPRQFRGADILLAIFACGDVPYIPGDPRAGQLWELGLERYGGIAPVAGAWRKVLDGGVRKPAPPRPSNFRLTRG